MDAAVVIVAGSLVVVFVSQRNWRDVRYWILEVVQDVIVMFSANWLESTAM